MSTTIENYACDVYWQMYDDLYDELSAIDDEDLAELRDKEIGIALDKHKKECPECIRLAESRKNV